MYQIIGADGIEYGPVDEAKIKEWLAVNRVIPTTLARKEGELSWKPLRDHLELGLGHSAFSPATFPLGGLAPDQNMHLKSRLAAGILGIFLGGLGVHRFYLGYVGIGILQIILTPCFGIGAIWGFIEGVMILCGAGITTDARGNPLRD